MASSNNRNKRLKTGPEQGKESRDAHRMLRFPCNRVFHVTACDRYLDCELKHLVNHVCYKDIQIPEHWRQFIMDNHKLGPMHVSVPRFAQLVMTE